MTAALGPWMLAHPDVKNKMEQFVMQFVVPEYLSSEPYLRAVVSPTPISLYAVTRCINFPLGVRDSRNSDESWSNLVNRGGNNLYPIDTVYLSAMSGF